MKKYELNLPNKLTLLRMIMVLLVVAFAIVDQNIEANIELFGATYKWTRFVLLGLFAVASYTDHLDGKIARKYNLITTFGKFLDPIADKLLVNSLTIILAIFNEIPLIIPVIYIIRDTIVDGIRLVCAQKNVVIAASKLGKLKTVTQMVFLIIALAFYPLGIVYSWVNIVIQVFAYLSAAISLVSGIDYCAKNGKFLFED